MIKSNTLPDIFKDKEKKKKKKNRKVSYYIHKQTKNKSFMKTYVLLKMLGIENNTFFLALYDTELIKVNPHDPDLDTETQVRVLKECSINPWYFLREVVRIPVSGSAKGSGKRYELHRGNLALTFCIINNLNSFTELPRQVGKSVAVDCMLLWLYNFGTSNSQMMLMNKDHDEAKNNLGRILNIRSALPEYLRFDTRMGAAGKRLKLPENKESMKHFKNGNELVTKPKATSKGAADKLGRGCTQPIQWYDEFCFLDYNDLIYKSATLAVSTASKEAAANGKPYGKIITSTPGDMKTDYGRYAYEFIGRSADFLEEFYDWTIDDIREYIDRISKNGFLYIKFSYKQLGKSQAYFDQQVIELDGDMDKVKREVLLHWNDGVTDSPFTKEDLEELDTMAEVRKPVRTIKVNKYYMLNLYEEIDLTYKTIISVDVAAGHAKDSSAIALISSKTKRIIGEFVNNKIDPTNLSAVIYTLGKVIIPNCLICIERNNAGEGVISNLKQTDIRHKLYYEIDKDVINEKVRNGYVQPDVNENSRKYGVWTGTASREQMYDILVKFVDKFKSRIAIPPMVDQIKTLQYIKGRIDHAPGYHDDLIMAYLIGMYVYYYGNLTTFGIIRFPDFETESEEEYRKFEEESNKPVYDRTLFDSNVDDSDENHVMSFDQKKTLDDYYAEIDKERAYYRGVMDQNDFNCQTGGNVVGDASLMYKSLFNTSTGPNHSDDDYSDIVNDFFQ